MNLGAIEQNIISILLNHPELILKTRLDTRYFDQHAAIIEKIGIVTSKGITCDFVALMAELGDDHKMIADVGWICRNAIGAAANLDYYLDVLKSHFVKTSIREVVRVAYHKLGEPEVNADDVVGEIISTALLSSELDGRRHNYTVKEALRAFMDTLELAYDNADTGGLGLKTGINTLDDTLGGMHPTDLIVVGGRPGSGKTAFGMGVQLAVMKSGKRCGMFSTEMPHQQVMARMVSSDTGIPSTRIRAGRIHEHEWALITAVTSRLIELDLRICDKPAITISEIAMQSRAWAATGGIDFILIDHLTRVRPDKPGLNRNQEVGEIARGLKDIARNLDIPVMVLAQLKRENTRAKGKRPEMAHLRDSGIIEEEADQIVLLYRPDEETGGGDEIIIDKNRHGECGIVLASFDGATTSWGGRGFYSEDYE